MTNKFKNKTLLNNLQSLDAKIVEIVSAPAFNPSFNSYVIKLEINNHFLYHYSNVHFDEDNLVFVLDDNIRKFLIKYKNSLEESNLYSYFFSSQLINKSLFETNLKAYFHTIPIDVFKVEVLSYESPLEFFNDFERFNLSDCYSIEDRD